LALYIHGNDAGEDSLHRELEEAIVDNGKELIEKDDTGMSNRPNESPRNEDSMLSTRASSRTEYRSFQSIFSASDTRKKSLSSPSLDLCSIFKLLPIA
jgi:hypothetical protein